MTLACLPTWPGDMPAQDGTRRAGCNNDDGNRTREREHQDQSERNTLAAATAASENGAEGGCGMCITNSSSTENETNDARWLPTAQAYGELHAAYDYFNAALFGGALPPCLITLQRKSRRVLGYYSSNRFRSNARCDLTTDEIAMNPIHFKGRNLIKVLQTLAHEMVHKWQHHFGKPSRGGYHNREWAARMMAIGLHPSSTGKPGGKMTGYRVSDYLIDGGPLAQAIETLTVKGFTITWYDRVGDAVTVPGPNAGEEPFRPGPSGIRIKYTCHRCSLNAWAKPRAGLICAACRLPMTAAPLAAWRDTASEPGAAPAPPADGCQEPITHPAARNTPE
jgi:hypothetical protein